MKKVYIIIIFLLFLISDINAQRFNIEPGATIGTSYYLGDINHTKQFYSPGLTFGLSFRHTFSDFYALRVNILRSAISGNDADFSNTYQQLRGYSFSNTIYEFGAQYEINFLSFNTGIKKSQTPYLTVGIAIASANSFQTITPVIPLGIGYKFSPSKKLTVNIEWCFRNTFSDQLDLLEQPNLLQKQLTKTKNYDWYSVAGIILTYNFASDKKWCPAYSKKRKY